jgi:predicted RNA-binding protein associated with RNAse of E/G family
MRAPILERKQKPDGTMREYGCTLVRLTPGLAVIEFVMAAQGGSIFGTPIEVPPGSISHGYFWKRRPYNLYRIRRADGSLIAHRFDAVTDVRLSADAVEYRDLILDWWVLPDDTLIEEDRDEFDELLAAGKIAPADIAKAHEAERAVYSRYRHIIDDVVRLERKLGLA